jgi:hypothetical protein
MNPVITSTKLDICTHFIRFVPGIEPYSLNLETYSLVTRNGSFLNVRFVLFKNVFPTEAVYTAGNEKQNYERTPKHQREQAAACFQILPLEMTYRIHETAQ